MPLIFRRYKIIRIQKESKMYNKVLKALNDNCIPHYTGFNVNKRFMIFFYPRTQESLRLVIKECKRLKLKVNCAIFREVFDISAK